MPRKLCIAAGLVLAWSSLVGAQTAPRPETAETAAAMERAKRAAAGPMRAILQASKAPVRRKAGESDGPAVALPAAATEAATPPVQRSAAAAVEAAVPPPAPVAVVTSLVLPASALAGSAGAEVAPLAPSVSAPAAAPLARMVSPPLVAAPVAVAVQPQLLSMVEPVIPQRLMDVVPRVTEVQADLMLRADGTVSEVLLVQPVPRAWQRLLTVALEQWRFEPLAAARSHRVQLVFGEP